MARKDITDLQVCQAYREYQSHSPRLPGIFVTDILMQMTGQPMKVCFAAMERADARGYIEYGTSLRSGWLDDKGKALLATTE